jgi:hypothetical protein
MDIFKENTPMKALLEKLIILQQANKFTAFSGTRRFIKTSLWTIS